TFTDSTTFELVGPAEAVAVVEYDLDVVSLNSTGSLAELTANISGKPDIAPGRYTLIARNQAGVDNSDIQLLQGSPGPDLTGSQLIDRINSATSGQIINSRLDLNGVSGGGGGSGGTLYLYDNSPTPTTDTNVGDRMWLRVTGNTDGSPSSLAVDHDRFTALCGDGDGCDVSLGGSRFLVDGDNDPITPPQPLASLGTGGACKMFYDTASGSWSLENGCALWRQRVVPNVAGTGFELPTDPLQRGFKPYSPSSSFGFDSQGLSRPVLSYSFACYFSEAGPRAAGDGTGFVDDTDPGFHLVMAGSDWADYPTSSFPVADADRACILLIED
ncbi:MAG: hypothetical protein AAF658_04850, partial [Myxococcota bacterium]